MRRSKGFTFVELLVTIAILGGSVGALLAFFVQSMELNNTNRDISLAVSHMQYVLEGIRSSSGTVTSLIDQGEWNYDTDADFLDRGLSRLPDEMIQVQYGSTAPLTITVNLNWQMQNGRSQNLIYQTIDSGV